MIATAFRFVPEFDIDANGHEVAECECPTHGRQLCRLSYVWWFDRPLSALDCPVDYGIKRDGLVVLVD